jgi:hypothetical protein
MSHKTNKRKFAPRLTRHAIKALLNGRHAHIGGRTIPLRAKNLLKIAVAYTYEELLKEPGVGAVAAAEIQHWLEELGAALRPSE